VAQALALNPGVAASFPWLSNEAAGWEKYKFNNLKFCYYTRTGSNVPGSMMLAPDYDASDAAPVSEVQASAYEDCEEDAPWKDICCELRGSELMGDMKERYVRSGALAANQHIKTYDCGNLFACTVDGTAVNWGKLWVEYDVTLITPHVPPGGFQSTGTLSANGAPIAAATPFGSAPAALGSPAMSGAATNVLTMTGLIIGQEYSLATVITGTVITGFNVLTPVGCTLKTNNGGSSFIDGAATAALQFNTFTATAQTATLTYTITATTVVGCDNTLSVLAPQPIF